MKMEKYLVKIEDSCPYNPIPFWFVAESERIPKIGMEKSEKCDGSWNNTYPMCDQCSETRTRTITGLELYSKKRAKELKVFGKFFSLESLLRIS